jgi:hypothetical protein
LLFSTGVLTIIFIKHIDPLLELIKNKKFLKNENE